MSFKKRAPSLQHSLPLKNVFSQSWDNPDDITGVMIYLMENCSTASEDSIQLFFYSLCSNVQNQFSPFNKT